MRLYRCAPETPGWFLRALLLGSLLLTYLLTALPARAQGSSYQPPASVYRDKNGVPHIVGALEESVFYALGYEQGRDALYPAQINIKRYLGEARKWLGPAPSPLIPPLEDMNENA